MTEKTTYVIAQDGTGDFTSIKDALAFIGTEGEASITLQIKKGIYRERLEIRRPFLTLEGEGAEDTVIVYGLYARMMMEDGKKRGTFRSYSVLIDTHDVTVRNLTLRNDAGPGTQVGQALALYADGDRLLLEDCRLEGGQDTLFTAPLPPKEIEPDGFIGPKQHAPRLPGRHCYRRCFICGDVDFIFGGAAAWFEDCELFSNATGREINGYVTAASTPEGQACGYVFKDCRFTGNCPAESVYLGRPWRNFAKTVLLDCYLGAHICREGWNDWGKEEAHGTLFFAEAGSTGPGAADSCRPEWTDQLTEEQKKDFTMEKVLGGEDGWRP